MPFSNEGPLQTGGKWEQFSDGAGGEIRLEWRVDLSVPALELWGGRPDETAKDNETHAGLSRLATLQP